jgi:hypothetical protein
MKTTKTFLAALLLLGNIVASGTALAANGVISKDEATAGSYCHMKFPAMRESTLSGNNPVLKNQNSGDVIDFYGSCDETPTGQDQVHAQKLDLQQRHDED